MKVFLWVISIPNPKMIIPYTKINIIEEARPLKLIEQIIYSGKWILIPDSDLVELSIINTHFKGYIIIFHKQHWCAQGDMLS